MLLFGLGENAARAAAVQGVKDLCIPEPPRQNIMPGGNTGLRLTAPAGAFTIWVYWYIWLWLKSCSDVTTSQMRPPRPALSSFRVEMALCRGLYNIAPLVFGRSCVAKWRDLAQKWVTPSRSLREMSG